MDHCLIKKQLKEKHQDKVINYVLIKHRRSILDWQCEPSLSKMIVWAKQRIEELQVNHPDTTLYYVIECLAPKNNYLEPHHTGKRQIRSTIREDASPGIINNS
jgi:hypothetical protein